MKKQNAANQTRDPLPSCAFCEYAKDNTGDSDFVFCTRSACEISAGGLCSNYIYDLLKRRPLRLRLTGHLSPGLLDD